METTESVGTPADFGIPTAKDTGFDVNNFVGIGVVGAIIAVIAIIVGWKRSSNKPIAERLQEYTNAKKVISSEIKINDQQQAVLHAEVTKSDTVSQETKDKIVKIVDDAAVQVQQTLQEQDPRASAQRITQKWE